MAYTKNGLLAFFTCTVRPVASTRVGRSLFSLAMSFLACLRSTAIGSFSMASESGLGVTWKTGRGFREYVARGASRSEVSGEVRSTATWPSNRCSPR